MGLGVSNQIGAALEFPFAPWRYHFDVRLQRVVSQLKPDLIVAFAGRSMCDCIRVFAARNFDLTFSNNRPRQRSPHQINAFVDRVCFHRGPNVIAHKLFAQVLNVEFRCASGFRLFVEPVHLCALANVSAVTNDFAFVGLFQPAEHDRRVESAGVGQNNLVDILLAQRCYAFQSVVFR